jgi:hypothetical protein
VKRLLALCVLLGSFGAVAEDTTKIEQATSAAEAALEGKAAASESAGAGASILPDAPASLIANDKETLQKYLTTMRSYYDYRTSGYTFRERLFEWQLTSSRIIFVSVILLVLAGIYFAAVQFHVALATSRRLGATGATSEESGMATKIEISAKGVVVNSSILGVIILVLSLAFFYLYLVHVYPITDKL